MEGLKTCMDYDDVAWEKSEADYEAWEHTYRKDDTTTREVGYLIAKHRGGTPVEMFQTLNGAYNLIYRIKFKDGGIAIGRFPKPGVVTFPEEKLRVEVATMRYVQAHTTLPVPLVLYLGTSDESPEGLGPFVIMEWVEHDTSLWKRLRLPGLPPEAHPVVNAQLPLERVEFLYIQLADVLLQLSRLKLPRIGSLSQLDEDTWTVAQRPLSQQMNELVEVGSFPKDRLISTPLDSTSAYFEALSQQMYLHFIAQPHCCMNTYREGCSRFMARYLFRKLVADGRIPVDKSTNAGPFPLFFDDMRHSNILLSKTDRIVGIVDWEFVYSGPQGFTSSAPWWLLLDQPENWPSDRGPWLDEYQAQLDIFLRCMERKEDETIGQGRMKEDERLSGGMRRSLETGDFWIHYMVRRPWAFDAIYWREIDKRFFGDADDVFEERKKLLGPEMLKKMDALIQDKGSHHNKMCKNRTTCCEEWPYNPVYDQLMGDELDQDLPPSPCERNNITLNSRANGQSTPSADKSHTEGTGAQVDAVGVCLHSLKIQNTR